MLLLFLRVRCLPAHRGRKAAQLHLRCTAAHQPTLPSTIGLEKAINPFLRSEQPAIHEAVAAHSGTRPRTALECLAALRAWKDNF